LRSNPKAAKKLLAELALGLTFCDTVGTTIESILQEIDPQVNAVSPEKKNQRASNAGVEHQRRCDPPHNTTPPAAVQQLLKSGASPADQPNAVVNVEQKSTENVSAGNPSGSTLRRLRDKKKSGGSSRVKELTEADIVLTIEEKGKRKMTKKQIAYRHFGMTRFRSFKFGDYVAARPQSQDLWILARVMKDWEELDIPIIELINMNPYKRDNLFHTKVELQDDEDKDLNDKSKVKSIARQFVLPLPRTYEEAAMWGMRCRKGMRVYAMYPSTTSLYAATVVDNTTHCKGEDDIIVVEFDGDEDDITRKIPERHIPARFVSLVPDGFPAAQVPKPKKNKKISKATANSAVNSSSEKAVNQIAPIGLTPESLKEEEEMIGLLDFMDDDDFDFGEDVEQGIVQIPEHKIPRRRVKTASSAAEVAALRGAKKEKEINLAVTSEQSTATNTKSKRARKHHILPNRKLESKSKKKRQSR